MNENLHYVVTLRNTRKEEDGEVYARKNYRWKRSVSLHWCRVSTDNNIDDKTGLDQPLKAFNEELADSIISEVRTYPQHRRKVAFYIHGWHRPLGNSFKLDLLKELATAYSSHNGPVAKFIYLSWPSSGLRHHVDDRAYQMGYQNGNRCLSLLKILSEGLHEIGGNLILMTHSFGHHLLNAMLGVSGLHHIFDKTFLFASDIPHQCLFKNESGSGVKMANPVFKNYSTSNGSRLYDLTGLANISSRNFIFYNPYDLMLLNSTFLFVSKLIEEIEVDTREKELIRKVLCLGNVGADHLHHTLSGSFQLVNAHDLIREHKPDRERFPKVFKKKERIDAFLEEPDHFLFGSLARLTGSLLNKDWEDLHRYFLTSEAVRNDISHKLLT